MSSYRRLFRAQRLINLMKANRGMTSTGKQPIFDVETRKDFEQRVINSDRPVVVDFHASWCCPCKALAPRLENVVSEQEGRVRLARVDIDEHGELALDYNVGSVPSLVVISNGKVVNRMVGLQTSEYLRKWLHKAVPHPPPEDSEN
ncbi:thioredoxin, mitochondrial [Drosophila santomea]|uniref:thioredoxin, mitochondrial n=1 Tax=Drosophila santomea TaxID=129105 RepID=UPI0019547AA3|nr:thioredoxin, mitochondrial [Drosophila santomea]